MSVVGAVFGFVVAAARLVVKGGRTRAKARPVCGSALRPFRCAPVAAGCRVFGNFRKFSEIFGKSRIFARFSEIFGFRPPLRRSAPA